MPRGQLWQVAHDRALLDAVEDTARGWAWIDAGNRPQELLGRTKDALHKRFARLTAAQTRVARAFIPPVAATAPIPTAAPVHTTVPIPAIAAPNIGVVVAGHRVAPVPAVVVHTTVLGAPAQHASSTNINTIPSEDPVGTSRVVENLDDDILVAESEDEPAAEEPLKSSLRGRKRTREARREESDRDSSASDARNVRPRLLVGGTQIDPSSDDVEEEDAAEDAAEDVEGDAGEDAAGASETQQDVEDQQSVNEGQQSDSEQEYSDWDIEGDGPAPKFMKPYRYSKARTGIRNVGDLLQSSAQVIGRRQYAEELPNLRPIMQRAFTSDLANMGIETTTQDEDGQEQQIRAPAAELAGGYHMSTPSLSVANRDDLELAVYADHEGNVQYDNQSAFDRTNHVFGGQFDEYPGHDKNG